MSKRKVAETRDGFLAEDAPRRGADDELAEFLAESYLASATSGEAQAMEAGDAVFEEEIGGPFLEVSMERDFAHDVDPSNPRGSEREAVRAAARAVSGRRGRVQ